MAQVFVQLENLSPYSLASVFKDWKECLYLPQRFVGSKKQLLLNSIFILHV